MNDQDQQGNEKTINYEQRAAECVEAFRPLADAAEKLLNTRNGVTRIKRIASSKVNQHDIFAALMSLAGAKVGGTSADGDKAYSDNWEWFDPFAVTDISELPEHWQQIVNNQNAECWRLGYRFVHAPDPILGSYPQCAARGIFVVTRRDATLADVTADDLVHAGGQFTEYDTKDKDIAREWIPAYAEQEVES